jgi:hypothetical protein
MCEVLHAMGFKNVIGCDYSPQAIILAKVRIGRAFVIGDEHFLLVHRNILQVEPTQ